MCIRDSPGVPAACSLYMGSSGSTPLAVFVPTGQRVHVAALRLGTQVREATPEEYADMHTWYNARMRIDHALSGFTEVDPMMQSEHLAFGNFSLKEEAEPDSIKR
eukprot:TRINITY_DN11798_c0_g1_i5.p1 TRINITY_DN11798_c0_g1~~TRINITY_DN11798_c0_g1_i5.p1  ORF type:complete len:105 (+),score=19.55 TRINITY_DN11798_c0_g1_i5:122-436(+)